MESDSKTPKPAYIESDPIYTYLAHLPPGRVRAFVAEDVTAELAALEVAETPDSAGITVVAKSWSVAPATDEFIDDALHALAEAALGLWPRWYGELDFGHCEADALAEAAAVMRVEEYAHRQPAVSIAWARAALPLARQQRLALPAGFPRATQCKQLAIAIAPRGLVVLLALDIDQGGPALLSAANGAEWLAQATGVPVAMLIPRAQASCSELERVLYDAIWLCSPTPAPVPHDTAPVEQKVRVWPFTGYPHPFSPGERLLAQHLARDVALASLFDFNQPIITAKGNRYTVDMLWAEGAVIVEVDGHHYHSSRYAFAADRQRDYELLVSGYLVLRLAHDEVVSDPNRALEKIRDVVTFRRSGLTKGEPT